jgi:hypothetical protein
VSYQSLQKGKKTTCTFFSLRGTSEFLTIVREIFEKDIGLEERTRPIRISSGHGALEYGGNGIVSKITDYLYKDATIYLERKYEIASMAKILSQQVQDEKALKSTTKESNI